MTVLSACAASRHETFVLAHTCINVVIASAAKQSKVFPRRQSGLLRCARNDGVRRIVFASTTCISIADTPPPSRGLFARVLLRRLPLSDERGRREDRVLAGTRGPLCERCATKIAQRHTGEAENNRPSLRSGLTTYVVLSPGSDALLPPSPCGWLMCAVRSGHPHHRKTWRTDSGRQDHTIWPYASRTGRAHEAFAHGCPPCEHLRADVACVHRRPARVS